MSFTMIASEERAVLDSLPATGGVLDGSRVHLFTNAPAITKRSLLTDFTEATFPGYSTAVLDLTFAPAFTDSLSESHVRAAHVVFLTDDAILPEEGETITGYYVTNADDDELIGAENFAAPVTMTQPGDACIAEVDYQLGE